MGQLFWMGEEAMSQRTRKLLGAGEGSETILSKTLQRTQSCQHCYWPMETYSGLLMSTILR